ncbi:peptidase S41 [Lentzea sp. PSKA42]|uniref:Peptidase S41 n=1 Tax=Lentzea indica TaxID=2604800 RepID=A0ABX1FG30_9PSEU|nr:S41 family peptidase [Lentzea indica]NKE57929.1 peptidase S41 [Lentzea indica]
MRADRVRAYVDKALDLLERHSMESTKADWPALRAEAHLATAGASAPEDTYAAIRQVIATLGNPHTHLITSHRAGASPKVTVPTGRMIGSTAHLLLPRTASRNRSAYVTAGLKVMRGLITRRPSGWVVDLRGNGGGDMYPMLTVASPLLGEGKTGAFVTPDGTTTEWGIRARHVYQGRRRTFVFRRIPKPANRPVAVLTNGRTASSGEAVLVSFLGAENVHTFGEPTAGFATANQTFPLPDGARLAITTAHMADRTGRTYGNAPIAPMTLVSNSGDIHDRVLDTAIAWLTGL